VKQGVLARRYIVSGRVQGVGFRNYVEHIAGKLDVHGYVRNRRDGSVEVLAIATPERLKQLRFALEKGPMLARVLGVSEEPDTPDTSYVGDFIIETTIE
jgi:acylphosphatase